MKWDYAYNNKHIKTMYVFSVTSITFPKDMYIVVHENKPNKSKVIGNDFVRNKTSTQFTLLSCCLL